MPRHTHEYFHSVLRRTDWQGRRRYAVCAAAYQARQSLRFGHRHFDFSHRRADLEYEDLLLPETAPDLNRQQVWSLAERAETFKDGVLLRRVVLGLPHDWSVLERAEAVRQFCLSRYVSQGMIVDLAGHDPGLTGDEAAQPHAHLLLSVRRFHGGRFRCRMEMEWAATDFHIGCAGAWLSLTGAGPCPS